MRPIVKVALAAAVLPTLAMAQERQRPPAPLPLAEAQFPAFVEFELENGLRVVLVPSEKQPVLSMQLSVLAGTVFDRRPERARRSRVGTDDEGCRLAQRR